MYSIDIEVSKLQPYEEVRFILSLRHKNTEELC
jgi:hypothetical protein